VSSRPTPIWLSHHYPDQYDRCVRVGSRHVCRRCFWMYPVAFAIGIAAAAGYELPSPWSQLVLVLFPLPALVEFVGEHRGLWDYTPTRHAVLSFLQGIGVGVGFGRYLDNHTDLWWWGIGTLYSLIALAAALTGKRPDDRTADDHTVVAIDEGGERPSPDEP
jgi:hypothetical protein